MIRLFVMKLTRSIETWNRGPAGRSTEYMRGMGSPARGDFSGGLPAEPQGVPVMMCDEASEAITGVGGRSLARLIREGACPGECAGACHMSPYRHNFAFIPLELRGRRVSLSRVRTTLEIGHSRSESPH